MKIIKKLKVLVSLLTIFSLFSLTNVSAMEEKDKIINKNIYEQLLNYLEKNCKTKNILN